jgi:hypothetical protein
VKRLAKTALAVATLVLGCAPGACGGKTPPPANPEATVKEVTEKLVQATREEAIGDPAKARTVYLDLMENAWGSSPWEIVATAASMDALVARSVNGLREVSPDTALAYRLKDYAFFKGDDEEQILSRVVDVQRHSHGPFAKGLIARQLEALAEHHGDWAGGERWRAARGCAREATVMGPVSATTLAGVHESSALDAFDAPVPADYTTPGAFGRKQAPLVVRGRGCRVDLSATGFGVGVREVVIDAEVPRHELIGVALRARSAATLRVGGKQVIDRPYELGADDAVRFARVDVKPGVVRIVLRVAVDEDGQGAEIGVFDDQGDPLRVHAPKPGERANQAALTYESVGYPLGRTPQERTAIALGALALGDPRTAERMLAEDAKSPKASPELLLAYARAVESAYDLSVVHRAERSRAAYERVLEAWPQSWEAIVEHAVLAGVRRGSGESRIEALKDMDSRRAKAGPHAQPILDVFEATLAAHDHLFDRSRAALERASGRLEGTSLLADAQRTAIPRSAEDRVRFTCSPLPPNDRSTLDCYDALRDVGDTTGAGRELERVRTLLGGPDLYLPLAFRDHLGVGDARSALAAYDAMLPGERTITATHAAGTLSKGKGGSGDKSASAGGNDDLRERLLAAAPTSRDAPSALAPSFRALGEDPAAAFAGIAEQVTAADRARPMMANAATVVLAHTEKYDVDPRGIVRFVMFDVRRVSGTTDVEENAQADVPDLTGRASSRVLRRRIFKKDGRVLEPDRTPNASQGHADLSQLEQGDAVEAIYEGWGIPGETGDIGIDTPDLLPDRTAVVSASIEIRLPKAVKPSLWNHAILGKPQESAEGDRRVLRWSLKDRGVRRIEESTPKMDRNVAVSLTTLTWDTVGRSMKETLGALVEHDPEPSAWAHEAVKKKHGDKPAPTKELVETVVAAAGEAVREAAPSVLSDITFGSPRGAQTVTARTILTDHEGSRSWLIVRSLRELGVLADVAVAENDPFSADPAFPPHFGRFMHPLVVAHVPDPAAPPQKKGKPTPTIDIWIDADVPGPPLPAGRISPELRGRSAILQDGHILPLPAMPGGDEKDEIDLRLALDDKGDARGTFTILLRGREAQEIAEALVRVVGSERQRALRGVVLAWVPFANVDEVALSSSEGSWQISLRADLTVPGYAQAEGGSKGTRKTWVLPGIDPVHIVFPRAGVGTLSSTYAGQGARENALAISRAVQYHAHRRIELPPGAKIERMPGPLAVKTPAVEAQRTLSVNGNVLEDDFILGIATGTIPPDQYGAFVGNVHKTDDAFLASTRVVPPGATPVAPAKK